MVLVDTSVWINHLHRSNARLERLLRDGQVVCHNHVIGEIACGRLRNRKTVLELLQLLGRAAIVDDDEALFLIERERLWGCGLGWVDIHLLASARLSACHLWTTDSALRAAARSLGVEYDAAE